MSAAVVKWIETSAYSALAMNMSPHLLDDMMKQDIRFILVAFDSMSL